jgi:hypothetical protein
MADRKTSPAPAGEPCTCNARMVDHWTAAVDRCMKHPEVIEYINRRDRDPEYQTFRAMYDQQFRQPWRDLREQKLDQAGVRDPAALPSAPRTAAPQRTAQHLAKQLAGSMPRPPRAELPPSEDVQLPPVFDLFAERKRLSAQLEALPDTSESAGQAKYLSGLLAWCAQHPEAGREEYRRATVEIKTLSAAGVV